MAHNALIVDDSKLARMVMASAFRRIRPDWALSEATNANEALSAISGGAVEIVLIDFNMPGTDGLELVARIRQFQDEIIARARELNATFIAKPLTDEALGAFLSGAALRLRNRRNDNG
jgi:CheY-like chemotaxis protein